MELDEEYGFDEDEDGRLDELDEYAYLAYGLSTLRLLPLRLGDLLVLDRWWELDRCADEERCEVDDRDRISFAFGLVRLVLYPR